MTVEERKMTVAYADLLNVQDLLQHVVKMGVIRVIDPKARLALASASVDIETVIASVVGYISAHTDFSEGGAE